MNCNLKNAHLFPALILIASCLNLSAPAFPQSKAIETSPAPAADPKIRIGPGDLLEVKVFDIPEMNQIVRVDDRGDASFALIGTLHLAGLTPDQSQTLLAETYQAGHFLQKPEVSVFIHEYSTQGATVVGEVAKPGVYPVLGTRSLLDILSEAGGTTSTAGNEIVTQRHSDGSTVTVQLMQDAKLSLSSDIEIEPGDRIIVPRAGIVYVIGAVNRPGGFVMQNDGKITMLQALALASGALSTASMNGARLIRKSPSGYVTIPIALKKIMDGHQTDQQMENEDILYVPNHAGKAVLYGVVPGIIQSATAAAIYHTPY